MAVRTTLWDAAEELALDYDVRAERPVRVRTCRRGAGLARFDRAGARLAENFEPLTAEPLGSLDRSWTAAVALDWLAGRN